MLAEIIELDTPQLCTMFAHLFWHHPMETLSDAIWLAHTFDHEARAVKGDDPPRADAISMQATRLQRECRLSPAPC